MFNKHTHTHRFLGPNPDLLKSGKKSLRHKLRKKERKWETRQEHKERYQQNFGSWTADALVINNFTERKKPSAQKQADFYHRISEKAQKLEASSTSAERGVGGAKRELVESLYNVPVANSC